MAIKFDEINQHCSIADDAALTFPAADWSLALWVKLDDNAGTGAQFALGWGLNGATPTFNLRMNETDSASNPNKLSVNLRDAVSVAVLLVSSTTPGTSTAWQHVTLVRSSGTITLYVDGTSVASDATGTIGAINLANALIVGGRSDVDSASFLGGAIAELAKWERALPSTEITNLAAGYPPKFYGTSLTYYRSFWTNSTFGTALTVTEVNAPTYVNHPPIKKLSSFTGPHKGLVSGLLVA